METLRITLCFYCITVPAVQCYLRRWPSLDDLALSVNTKMVCDSKNRLISRNEAFRVEFYVTTSSSGSGDERPQEAQGNKVLVVKFQLPDDGKHVTEIYDSLNNIHVTKIILLGEIAIGQPPFRQLCFARKLIDPDILSAESVLRLRQKNSFATRIAEETSKPQTIFFPAELPSSRVPIGSKICDNVDRLYLTEDIYYDLKLHNNNEAGDLANATALPLCDGSGVTTIPCKCRIKYWLPWYPCGWKYCDDDQSLHISSTSNSSKYRCGVKSCRVARVFHFHIPARTLALCDAEEAVNSC